jgi:hypothetical protein
MYALIGMIPGLDKFAFTAFQALDELGQAHGRQRQNPRRPTASRSERKSRYSAKTKSARSSPAWTARVRPTTRPPESERGS